MILMALDHASYFVIKSHFYEGYDYIYLNHTLLTFMTRFVSHLCAPGFFFVLGYGAYKKFSKGKSMRYALISRGVFLIFLQFTLENLAWNLASPMNLKYVGVLFVLGVSLILIGIFVNILKRYGHIIGLILIILTQVLITDNSFTITQNTILRFLFVPGQYNTFYILYVVVPWFGLASIGVYFSSRKSIPYFSLSLWLFLIFTFIRMLGLFGNTHLYTSGFISFFNVTKYPPSIAFISLTMSINFLLMGCFDYYPIYRIKHILKTYGNSALLFYILHLYVYLAIGKIIATKSYIALYITWLLGLALLYYPCKYLSKRNIKKYLNKFNPFLKNDN